LPSAILTKLPTESASVATDVGFSFDATVAIAGLLSRYIGLFSYIFRPQRTAGKSFRILSPSCCPQGGVLKRPDHLQQGIAVPPRSASDSGSSPVRRLVRAKDDPAKQRIRRSSVKSMMRGSLALASIGRYCHAAWREVAAEWSIGQPLWQPIAGLLDATDAVPKSDPARREHVS
jgi:hypothetical protein